MILTILIETVLAFFASVGFSVLFNIPKKELLSCGFSGAICWFCYKVVFYFTSDAIGATFVGCVVSTSLARFFSYQRKMPVIIYMIAGVIPVVPGAGIYYTMYEMIVGQNATAFSKGIETLKIAGIIAIGIIIALSLPRALFDLSQWKIKAKKM